jgi:hypothetical protein
MAIRTDIPNEKLSPWYFAIGWARQTVIQEIKRAQALGLSTAYDERHLVQLDDMEQFLKMSWDVWMDDLEENCAHSGLEVSSES